MKTKGYCKNLYVVTSKLPFDATLEQVFASSKNDAKREFRAKHAGYKMTDLTASLTDQ